MQKTTELSAEAVGRRITLVAENWSFNKANYGNVEYWRAAKDGWITVLDWQDPSEEAAINKAWERRQEVIDAQAIVMRWMKDNPNNAGISFDDIECKFIATYQDKVKGISILKEAKGDSPLLAVERWIELYQDK